jgi:predicted N-acyltransferase
MADGQDDKLVAKGATSLAQVDAAAWNALANPPGQPYYPFADWAFLEALERSGSVRAEVGWAPHHLILERDGTMVGALPLYLKAHSRGEFVFDYAWADAYERAGGRYYPKLLGGIPFTPAPGPRLLAGTEADREILAAAAMQMATELGVSSLHVSFPTAAQTAQFEALGYLIRTGQQYHFTDEGYGDWQGFLGALASRKRKALRKERDQVAAAGIEIDWLTGADITEEVLDRFWVFYQDTGSRKWGTPYLTRRFFSLIAERMADRMLFVMARREGRTIAGALNFIGGDTLYGRYWGCTEHVPFLHFEVCYYQAIDYALAHGLGRVDAGAQGEHKIARGYTPTTTWSAHHIADPGFRRAVARYLEAERAEVAEAIDYLSDFTPFRKGG